MTIPNLELLQRSYTELSAQVVEAVGQGAYGVVCSAKAPGISRHLRASGSSHVKSFLAKNGIVKDCVHIIICYHVSVHSIKQHVAHSIKQHLPTLWNDCSKRVSISFSGIGISIPQDELNDDTVAIKKIERLSSMPWCYSEHVERSTGLFKKGSENIIPYTVHFYTMVTMVEKLIYSCSYSRIFVQTDQSLSATSLQTFLYFLIFSPNPSMFLHVSPDVPNVTQQIQQSPFAAFRSVCCG